MAGGFAAAHPLVPMAEIPAQPEDVHDLEGLRRVGESFAARAVNSFDSGRMLISDSPLAAGTYRVRRPLAVSVGLDGG